MSHLTNEQLGELLTAYVDGEVDPREKAFVEHLLREDRRAATLLSELRGLSVAVAELPRHAAPVAIVEDIRQLVERAELLGGPPLSPRRPIPTHKPRRWAAMLGLAAMLGIAAAAALYVQRGPHFLEQDNGPLAAAPSPDANSAAPETTLISRSADEAVRMAKPARPVSEETYTKFVQDVLAMAGSPDDGSESEVRAPGRGRQTVGKEVLALELTLSDGAAVKQVVADVGHALRKFEDEARFAAKKTGRDDGLDVLSTKPAPARKAKMGGMHDGGVRKWAVRVPVSQLPKYADAVLTATQKPSQVTLVTGTVSLSGAAEAREALARVDRAWQAKHLKPAEAPEHTMAGAKEKASPTPEDESPRQFGPFAELFNIMGVKGDLDFIDPPPPALHKEISEAPEQPAVATLRAADVEEPARASGVSEIQPESVADSAAPDGMAADRLVEGKEHVPGLVHRRLKELHDAPARPVTPDILSVAQDRAESPSYGVEKYVTLVVTVAINSPAQPGASRPAVATPSNQGEKPKEDRPAG